MILLSLRLPGRIWNLFSSRLGNTLSMIALLACMVSGHSAHAQTFPPPAASSTPTWEQNFSALSTNAAWEDVDGTKETAHPTNALVVVCPSTPPGTTSNNCFRVRYNQTGGPS